MIKHLLLFGSASLLCLALTPFVQWLAVRLKVMDAPDPRKVHQRSMPRWGGLAIVTAFLVVLLLTFSPLALVKSPWLQIDSFWWTGFLVGAGIIVGLGAVDDVHSLGAKLKLFVQIAAALVVVAAGCVIDKIQLPGGSVLDLGWFSIPVSVLWIVGVTNAFNLIDGLDGLACGIGLIASLTLATVGLLNQSMELAFIGFILAGALLGFLRHNFHPATIFMGDSGSLFIGFTLAVLSIRTAHKSTAAASLLIPVLACGLPIMEVLLSFARRFFRAARVWETTPTGQYRFFPFCGKSIFVADREHIHHRLLRLGLTHARCVMVLYGACAGLGLLALAAATIQNLSTGLILAAVGWASVLVVRKLRYDELQWLKNGVLLPFLRHRILGQAPFQMLADLVLIPLAYYIAYWLHFDGAFGSQEKASFIATVPFVLVIKLAVCSVTGLYHIKWSYAGFADALRTIRSLLLATAAVFAAAHWLPGLACHRGVLFMDFFVLSSLVLATRFSVRGLEHYRNPDRGTPRRALIYGAGHSGSLAIRELLNSQPRTMIPIGFVDDAAEGTQHLFLGYPVLGTSYRLLEIAHHKKVNEVIVATRLGRNRLEALKSQCNKLGICVRQFQVQFVEV